MDLSEWLATLYDSDLIPTGDYDSENLTGSGRSVGNSPLCDIDDNCQDVTRQDAETRAAREFSTSDMSDNANTIKNTFDPSTIDCSVYPRPLICEIQN